MFNPKTFLLPLPISSSLPRAPTIPFTARTLLLVCVALYVPTITIFCWTSFSSSSPSSSYGSTTRLTGGGNDGGTGSGSRSEAVYNETLGFGEIFYISLPQRQDRQDIMETIASFSGLKFTMIPGVNGSLIPAKSMPYPPTAKTHPRPPEVGCWRAHANVWKQMLAKNLETALILEDDIDFSTGFRSIFENISTHLNSLTAKALSLTHPSAPHSSSKNDVYGLGNTIPSSPPEPAWDVLTLGHCAHEFPPKDTLPLHASLGSAWLDPFAPKDTENIFTPFLPNTNSLFNIGLVPRRVRAIRPTYEVVCTHAYVVTKRGAQRLLHNIGGPGGDLTAAVDLVMSNLFKDGRLSGYTVLPSIFQPWKYDNSWMDSDLEHLNADTVRFDKGSGPDIVGSMRVEMERVLKDGKVWEVDKLKVKGGR